MILKDLRKARLVITGHRTKEGYEPCHDRHSRSLSNPYWVIVVATIGLGYLVSSLRFGIAGVALFFLGHISADLAWYSIISMLLQREKGHGGQRIQKSASALRVFLICFGGWFIQHSLEVWPRLIAFAGEAVLYHWCGKRHPSSVT